MQGISKQSELSKLTGEVVDFTFSNIGDPMCPSCEKKWLDRQNMGFLIEKPPIFCLSKHFFC